MTAQLAALQEQLAQRQRHQTESDAKCQKLSDVHGDGAGGRQEAFTAARRLGGGGAEPASSSGQRETAAGRRYDRVIAGGFSPSIGQRETAAGAGYDSVITGGLPASIGEVHVIAEESYTIKAVDRVSSHLFLPCALPLPLHLPTRWMAANHE